MSGAKGFERDVIPTSEGDLEITFLGHGTLMMAFQNKCIHVDPYSSVADYGALPKADLVLITHEHGDHLDMDALAQVTTEDTEVVLTPICAQRTGGGKALRNGERTVAAGIPIEAAPAYNVQHKRPDGAPFHPPGAGNGYVLTLGDVRVYVAGDTEVIPEMGDLEDIDVAFLPMNLPYTMTPEMAAEAARAVGARIVYPYHFGNTDTSELVDLLAGEPGIEVRIRNMA